MFRKGGRIDRKRSRSEDDPTGLEILHDRPRVLLLPVDGPGIPRPGAVQRPLVLLGLDEAVKRAGLLEVVVLHFLVDAAAVPLHQRLGERAGTHVRGVYKWHLSEKSKKANAALTGLGNTRRVILADTLLDNYSPDEIEAVLAHELGHHVHRHILKSIFVQAGITLVGFWAANWALHYAVDHRMFEHLSDFANLPLLVLVSVVLSLLLMPALSAYSRYNERQADRYAFASIPAISPFVSAMNKLAEQNLAERTPSKWVEWFFHSHPAISKRVKAAETWAKVRAAADAGG